MVRDGGTREVVQKAERKKAVSPPRAVSSDQDLPYDPTS